MLSRIFLLCLIMVCAKITIAQTIIYPARNADGNWGYIDSAGNTVVDYVYQHASDYYPNLGYAIANNYGEHFVIYPNGKSHKIIQAQTVIAITKNRLAVKSNNVWHITKLNGEPIKEINASNFDRQNTTENCIHFIKEKYKGAVDSMGEILLEPIYYRISRIHEAFYFLLDSNKKQKLIYKNNELYPNEKIQNAKKISLQTINLFYIEFSKNQVILNENAIEIIRSKNIIYKAHDNDFIAIKTNSDSAQVYDAIENKFIPELYGSSLTTMDIKDAIIYYKNGLYGLYQRYNRTCYPPQWKRIESESPYIIQKDLLFGALDENLEKILPEVYPNITTINNFLLGLTDSVNTAFNIFSLKEKKILSKYKYINCVDAGTTVKAYMKNKSMHYFEFDSSNKLIETTVFNKVITKVISDNELLDVEKLRNWANNNSTIGNRKSGWYATQQIVGGKAISLFGLSSIRDSGRKILIPPFYHGVRVLDSVPVSIAILNYTSDLSPFAFNVGNFGVVKDVNAMQLVNDITGKRLSGMYEFIDEKDVINKKSNSVRYFHLGEMALQIKGSNKTKLKATYISEDENGVRRVVKKGKYTVREKNSFEPAVNDINLWNSIQLGFLTNNIAKKIFVEGEWILFKNNSEIKINLHPTLEKVTYIEPFENGRAIFYTTDQYAGVIDTNGKVIIKPIYKKITRSKTNKNFFYCAIEQKKSGLMNAFADEITPPVINGYAIRGDAVYFYDRSRKVTKMLSPSGTITEINGTVKISDFSDGFGFAKRNNRYLLLDSNFNEILGAKEYYTGVTPFSNGFASVRRNDDWFIINTYGEKVSENYKALTKVFYTCVVSKKSIINKFISVEKEKIKSPNFASAIEEISPNILLYKRSGKYGLYDKLGNVIVGFTRSAAPFVYKNYIVFCYGKNTMIYNINTTEKKHFTCHKSIYKSAILGERPFTEKIKGRPIKLCFSSVQSYLYGLDSTGKKFEINYGNIIPALIVNQELGSLQKNGLFLVRFGANGNCIVNNKLEIVGPRNIIKLKAFQDYGYICQTLEGTGIISVSGAWIVPPKYTMIKPLKSNLYMYYLPYGYDIINHNGLVQNADILDYVSEEKNNIVKIGAGDKMGYFNAALQRIIYFQ